MLNRQIFKATFNMLSRRIFKLNWPHFYRPYGLKMSPINALSPWFTAAECLLYEDTSAEDHTPKGLETETDCC